MCCPTPTARPVLTVSFLGPTSRVTVSVGERLVVAQVASGGWLSWRRHPVRVETAAGTGGARRFVGWHTPVPDWLVCVP
jgi:hypothetical protein